MAKTNWTEQPQEYTNQQTQSRDGGLNYDHPGGLVIKWSKIARFDVAMYKDEPGIYYAPNGRRVTEEHARDAGFDIEAMRHLRERDEYMRDARSRFDQKSAPTLRVNAVIATENGIQVVEVSPGKHILRDSADGYNLTTGHHLTREEAMAELARFATPPAQRSEHEAKQS